MATKNIVPRATGEGSLGTSAKRWGNIYADNITLPDDETLGQKITSISGVANTAKTTADGVASTVSTHTAQLAGTADSALKEQIAQLDEDKVDIENTTSFTISAGEKSLVGNSDGALTWGGKHLPIKVATVYASNGVEVTVGAKEFACSIPSDRHEHIAYILYQAWAGATWANGAIVSMSQDKQHYLGQNSVWLTTNVAQTYAISIKEIYV